MKIMRAIFAAIILMTVAGLSWAQSSQEAAGKAAEQAGKYREALGQYTAALGKAAEGSADGQRIREAVIRVAKRISGELPVPQEAERRMARGRAAAKAATDEQGFMRAAEEFRQAVNAAPWLPNGYFNLGVTLDRAGKYPDAIRNLKLYLLGVKNEVEAKQGRELIFEIEYRQEEAQRVKLEEAKNPRQAEIEKQKQFLQSLAGQWIWDSGNSIRYFQIALRGENSFSLKYLYTENRPVPNIGPSIIEFISIDANVNNGRISGQGSFGIFGNAPFCPGLRASYAVTGNISDDGQIIELIPLSPEMDFSTGQCRLVNSSQSTRITRAPGH